MRIMLILGMRMINFVATWHSPNVFLYDPQQVVLMVKMKYKYLLPIFFGSPLGQLGLLHPGCRVERARFKNLEIRCDDHWSLNPYKFIMIYYDPYYGDISAYLNPATFISTKSLPCHENILVTWEFVFKRRHLCALIILSSLSFITLSGWKQWLQTCILGKATQCKEAFLQKVWTWPSKIVKRWSNEIRDPNVQTACY